MDDIKIEALRNHVLYVLKEFIPSTWYKGCSKRSDLHRYLSFRDFKLWEHIISQNLESPKMSPREIAATHLLQEIGLFCLCDNHEPADEIPSMKENCLIGIQESLDDYARYLSPGEARELKISESAIGSTQNVRKEANKGSDNKKVKREHELRNLIKKTYDSLGSPNANNIVWNALKKDVEIVDQKRKYDEGEIIQEMDNKTISWMSWRGNEKKMARATFNNRLSELRNPEKHHSITI